MTLDGWSLNRKIDKLRESIENEMRELKMNFAMLYDYMKKQEVSNSNPKTKKKKQDKN